MPADATLLTALFSAGAVLLAAFIKGAIGVGFPTLATPLLTLVIDVKPAVAVLIVPNIVMDGLQVLRRGGLLDTARRLAVLLVSGGIGTVLGTHVLTLLPSRAVILTLGGALLVFVTLNVSRFTPRVPAGWEPWLSPLVGLLAGLVGGVTNVHGPPLVVYFYALQLDKARFVASISFAFLVYKVVQLGALVAYGLLTWPLLGASMGLTVVGLGSFALGLRLQDRLAQATFNRVVLGSLAALGAWLILRAMR